MKAQREYTWEDKVKAIISVVTSKTVGEGLKKVDIERSTWYYWRNNDKEFEKAYQEAIKKKESELKDERRKQTFYGHLRALKKIVDDLEAGKLRGKNLIDFYKFSGDFLYREDEKRTVDFEKVAKRLEDKVKNGQPIQLG